MANVASQIEAAGARIVWVMQQTGSFQDGTAGNCVDFINGEGSSTGICVGDSQSSPQFPFKDSALSSGRGIDLIVDPLTMEIIFTAGHGTSAGNQNLDGNEILTAVEDAVADLQAGTTACD